MGHAPARRPRRRGDQDRGSGRPAATSAATCRRSRRARTRSSSRRSTATSRASRSTCATPEARGVFEDLVRVSDVVYSNLRGDQPAKLGLTYDAAEARQPADRLLLALRLRDDRAARRGGRLRLHDAGARGLAEPDRRPRRAADEERPLARRPLRRLRRRRSPCSPGCGAPGATASAATATSRCFDTALHELMYVGTWAASRGYVPPRRRNSAHPSIVPFQNFPTADGWIVVACPKEKFWRLLCDAIGRPELGRGVPDASPTATGSRDELEPILEEVFRGADERGVARRARPRRACRRRAGERRRRPRSQEARLVEYEHPQLGTVRQVASPLRLSGDEPPARPAPARGEDTEQVLVELCGYAPARVQRARRRRRVRSDERSDEWPRQAIQPEGLATPKPPYSPVVVSGDTVYTAGPDRERPGRQPGRGRDRGADAADARERRDVRRGGRAARWTTSSR